MGNPEDLSPTPTQQDSSEKRTEVRDEVAWLLSQLPQAKACLLRLRYGIGSDSATLAEIAVALGVTGEAVRVKQNRVLEDLRTLARTGVSPALVRKSCQDEAVRIRAIRKRKPKPFCPPFEPGVVLEEW